MSDDDICLLTAEQAVSLLPEGEYVHNFANPAGGLMLGCDYERADAIKALSEAKRIEIGGEGCKRIKHPLAVWDKNDRLTFFAADMAKVEAFEKALT